MSESELQSLHIHDTVIDRLEAFRLDPMRRTTELTLVISDLVNSTDLYERIGQQHSSTLMETYRFLYRSILETFDAVIADERTEEFLIAFGSPSEAVRFALKLLAETRRLRNAHEHLPEVRIGISSGHVEVRVDGDRPRIIGRQVNEAGRYCSLSSGDQLICSR